MCLIHGECGFLSTHVGIEDSVRLEQPGDGDVVPARLRLCLRLLEIVSLIAAVLLIVLRALPFSTLR